MEKLSDIQAKKNLLSREITDLTKIISGTKDPEIRKQLFRKQADLVSEFNELAKIAAKLALKSRPG